MASSHFSNGVSDSNYKLLHLRLTSSKVKYLSTYDSASIAKHMYLFVFVGSLVRKSREAYSFRLILMHEVPKCAHL